MFHVIAGQMDDYGRLDKDFRLLREGYEQADAAVQRHVLARISEGDELLADASFNFELRNTYSIRVASTDQDGLSVQKAFSIQILDMAEAPPALVTAPIIAVDGITLQWNSLTNHTYTILVSDDLQAGFTVLESGVAATPPVNDYTDPTPPGELPRFWQILTDP